MQTRPIQTMEVHPVRRSILISVLALLGTAAPASAAVPHTVQPGETLWSIAAANNLTTRTVAAFNGLSEDAQVVLGSTVMVPTTVEGYAALQPPGSWPPIRPRPRPPRRRPRRRPPPRRPPRRPRAATRCAPATRSPASPPAPASPSPTWRP